MAEGKEGGKNDFAWALLIVFVIIGLLLAASIWFPYYPDGGTPEETTIHTFDAGVLGYTQNYVSRVQEYGSFGVGVPQDEVLRNAPRMEITAALLGGEREDFTILVPDYVEENKKGATITFTVTDTNKYGDLVVRWNGAEVYRGKAYEGVHEVEILPSQMESENTLEVYADGPGFMFWAATVYSIRDFSVTAQYGPAKFLDFAVSQDELETLDYFELAWYTKSRRGNLSVKINGEEIYNGYPDRDTALSFTDASIGNAMIRPGNNRMMFSSVNSTDSFELEDVIMNTHVSRSQRTVKEKVSITDAQLDRLQANGGTLRLYVTKVEKDGRITLKINEQAAGSGEGQVGWNNLKINVDLLTAGENWFEISSTGAFDISEAKVEMS